MSLNSIGSILGNKNTSSPMLKGVLAAQVVEAGNDALARLFGTTIKDHAECSHFRNKMLAVACLNSVVAQEIKLNERQLLSLVSEKVGKNMVERIKYIL